MTPLAWFIMGGFALLAFVAGGRAFATAEPRTIANVLRGMGGVTAGALGLLLTFRGQAAIGAVLIAGGAALIGGIFRGAAPGPGRARGASQVDTTTVRMTLNHETGEMDGEVLTGANSGRRLSDLDRAQIEETLSEALGVDPDAAALLHAYIERRFGGPDESGGEQRSSGAGGAMSRAEALSVLGLEQGASMDDIRAAHRRLMKALHPDHGGSSWLAAQINRAKETLLVETGRR